MSAGGDVLGPFLESVRDATEVELAARLPAEDAEPSEVHGAMRYSALGGGKRLRPALVVAACEAVGGDRARAMAAAAAVECIHVYSLIHDDLPAMDDDDVRRGKPSCHRAYDEATAILAGDGLLTFAFETLANGYGDDPKLAIELVRRLARAAGSVGMVGGQVIDMRTDGPRTEAALEQLHGWKTGALITSACELGALAGGATDAQLDALGRYGRTVGLAFQVTDDVLDVSRTSEELGKTAGKDAAAEKLTYPALLGLEGARAKANALAEAAVALLAPFGDRGAVLRALAEHFVARRQ